MTAIPTLEFRLIMAKNRGIPTLACHHGALDFRMAIKVNHADTYLAKSEMELDYLKRICQLPAEKIAVTAPPSVELATRDFTLSPLARFLY